MQIKLQMHDLNAFYAPVHHIANISAIYADI